jgi:hypothetical protein
VVGGDDGARSVQAVACDDGLTPMVPRVEVRVRGV